MMRLVGAAIEARVVCRSKHVGIQDKNGEEQKASHKALEIPGEMATNSAGVDPLFPFSLLGWKMATGDPQDNS